MTKQKLLLVKVGGKVVENPVALNQLISDLSKLEGRKVMVHGGGVLATKTAAALGIETTMVEGRRITDDKMIDVVTMGLCRFGKQACSHAPASEWHQRHRFVRCRHECDSQREAPR